jgi:hypothetical protein
MPTPAGTIKFSDITNEFGTPPGKNLGAFRVSRSVGTLSNLPLDVDVPQSGSISFGNLRNKRLNVVIDYTGLPDNSTRLNARSDYNANSRVVVIGGFKTRPSSPQNIRLIINANTRIGSAPGNQLNVALRTGNWRDSANNALTTVIMELGSASRIYGAGGRGGNSNGGNGENGTSAIGIDYPTTVNNQGRIQCGGGGGGAGAFRQYSVATGKKGKGRVASYSTGGGGGAGAGLPFGAGGDASVGAYGFGSNGSGGGSGNHESAGAGGVGGVEAGSGGGGGQYGNGANGGGTANQGGGSGGAAGFAFVISGSGSKSGGGGTIIGDDVSGEPT